MDRWYLDARHGAWHNLRWEWEQMTDRIESPEPGALIRFDGNNDDGSFGVGVLPDERTLITVRHYGRLIAGPLSACGGFDLYRLK